MTNWNNNFTVLLRDSKPNYWGNWALEQNINPGSICIIDDATNTITPLEMDIPGTNILKQSISQKWEISSKDVTEKRTNVDIGGSAIDPETGDKIQAGIDISWEFSHEGSLVSDFSLDNESILDDWLNQINNNMDWLKTNAEKVNMLTDDGIAQGFCVITNVIYANSGLNIGAKSNTSSFTIEGSVSGIKSMIGDAHGKGSYISIKSQSQTESAMWPSKPGVISESSVPIAFTVASFDGDIIIPDWTHLISSFELILNNRHGGTYIAHGELTYKVNGKTITKKNKASGGMTSAIRDIPINALDLEYKVTFTASGTKKVFKWASPVNLWKSGCRHIDVKGVWPGSPSATDREA